jgi:hypothetical protein
MIEDDDVGQFQESEATYRDKARVARSGPDKVYDAFSLSSVQGITSQTTPPL